MVYLLLINKTVNDVVVVLIGILKLKYVTKKDRVERLMISV